MTVNILEVATDYIRFECTKCGVEKLVVSDEVPELELDIKYGINPFEDGWEDGNGNTVVCECGCYA